MQALQAGRYDIHEMLRQYGEAQLTETGEADALRQIHSVYYMNFLAEREEDVKGRRQQAALEELRLDFENIRQGWLWAADHQQYEAIRQALNCLTLAYEMNNQLLDGQRLLYHTTLALQPAMGETPHRVWDAVSVRLERYNFLQGQVPDAELLQEILARTRAHSDVFETAWCHWGLGDYHLSGHDTALHFAYIDKCLAFYQQQRDKFYVAHMLTSISNAYSAQNQTEHAIDCLRDAALIHRRIGNLNGLPFSLLMLADKLIDVGFFNEAEMYLDEALTIMDDIGITPMFAHCQLWKARLAFLRGEFETACHDTEAALKVARKQNYIGSIDGALATSSYLLSLAGNYREARNLCEQSRLHPLIPWFARCSEWGYALAGCGLDDDEAARQALRNVLQITIEFTNSRTDQQLCLPIAAILSARAGHSERAVSLLGLAYSAPQSLTGWMRKWSLLTEVQNGLESQLGADAFAAAWERGQSLELPVVVAELLAEYAS